MQLAAFGFVQVQEVVALQQLVSELRKGKTVAGFAVQTLLDRVLSHHIIYGDVLAYFAGKIEKSKIFHPIVVVHQLCTVGSVRVKIQELAQLFLHARHVALQGFFSKQITFCRLAGRVANHTRSTAYQRQRLMAATLEVTQYHHTAKVSYVQGVCRRVETDVCSHLFFCQQFFRTRHHIVEHATPS